MKNVVSFPAFCSSFYGGVGIKPFGKSRCPSLLLWFISLPRYFGCQLWDLFHCFPYISSFSCTCTGAQQVPGSIVPRIFTPSWLFLLSSCLNWLPFLSSILVLLLHICALIPCSYMADYYLENRIMSEANVIVLLQYFAYILGDYMKIAPQSLNLALPKFLNRSPL